jgi:hypothetical protein
VTENAAIFFVRIFSKLGHLLIISSLAYKIFFLESLGFESSGGREFDGQALSIPEDKFSNTYKQIFQLLNRKFWPK